MIVMIPSCKRQWPVSKLGSHIFGEKFRLTLQGQKLN
jgi:hypothetical protein